MINRKNLMKFQIGIIAVMVLSGMYFLYNKEDLMAIISFVFAGFNFWRYTVTKKSLQSERTWRSYR